MAMRQIFQHLIRQEVSSSLVHIKCYKSNIDWHKLRPMIIKRVNNRAKDYPLKHMIPVANEVVEARKILTQGVSTLLKVIPVKSCKYCPEVYIGSNGHRIKTCHGFKQIKKNQEHKWINATIDGIINPKEAFHLHTVFQPLIKHEQRFDFDRISAILELCSQAGANVSNENLDNDIQISNQTTFIDQQSDYGELEQVGQQTIDAWERLRLGVQKLLLVYPAKVCDHCSEVHIGPSGHVVRVCGIFKQEGWRGTHHWKKAEVDDLVPLNVVWHRRPHDPQVLVDGGQGYYGHSPAVVELCMQAGAKVPKKYFCMMKFRGLAPNVVKNNRQKTEIKLR